MDYSKIGLKCGIEIHQQLETNKLFCSCPGRIRDEEPDFKVKRKIRAVAGELGEVDPAALHELLRDRNFIYEGYDDTVCLVELDEEPPHPLNEDALKICLDVALMLNATPVDELQVMRKTVIDGSNTSGFQRTVLVATDGKVMTKTGKEIKIPTICLEEDAARIISKEGNTTTYRLDRLGIPLIEIGTDPDISTPEEAREVAEKIGMILRATGKVKRGLGTIRQDLNVSIKEGRRIEIKGVQTLKDIKGLVENEVKRQSALVEIKKLLSGEVKPELKDVSSVFEKTGAKIIKNGLESNKTVLGVKLPGFKGITGRELMPDYRFGTELAGVAKSVAGVKGIFHSDELPKYGITQQEVDGVSKTLGLKEKDAFILVVERKDVAEKALNAIVERCNDAKDGVQKEVRKAVGESTEFLRPLPGSARMYPETDQPFIKIDKDLLTEIKEEKSLMPEQQKKELLKMGLNEELAQQLLHSRCLQRFNQLASKTKVKPSLIAYVLMGAPKEAEKKYGVKADVEVNGILKLLEKDKIARESVPEIMAEMSKNNIPAEKAAEKLDAFLLSSEELKARVLKIISENKSLNMGALMGKAMAELRGKAQASDVAKIIKGKI